MNAEIIKALLVKYIQLGVSREFFLSAVALLVILFGKDFGLPVDDPITKLAISIVSVGAVVGVLGKKWLEQGKPKDLAEIAGRIEDITIR